MPNDSRKMWRKQALEKNVFEKTPKKSEKHGKVFQNSEKSKMMLQNSEKNIYSSEKYRGINRLLENSKMLEKKIRKFYNTPEKLVSPKRSLLIAYF